ncbi:MAG TPA: GNAT family N-acetyltransferase, partial [Exiguobacterium sp.]|nr:GNAT family N-acetyltransferase [Exiguobacterium sp.]
MNTGFLTIRRADMEDAAAIARIHVASWRETYRTI